MSDCNYCEVEKDCHYPFKPCDCVHQRKFWSKEKREEYDAKKGGDSFVQTGRLKIFVENKNIEMEQTEIKAGNILIAEFMGAEFLSAERLKCADDCIRFEGEEAIPLNKHDYSTTWGLLMPVLEKICRLRIGDGVEYIDYATPRTFGMLCPETEQIMVRLNSYQLFKADTLILATWLAVVDFVKLEKESAVKAGSGNKTSNDK